MKLFENCLIKKDLTVLQLKTWFSDVNYEIKINN
jgi:hypothetical protein